MKSPEKEMLLLAATRDDQVVEMLRGLKVRGIRRIEIVPSAERLVKRIPPGSDDGVIRIILLDDELEDRKGRDLIAELHQRRRNLKIVFMAAEPDEALEVAIRREGVYFFTGKPLEATLLRRVVEKAVEHETTVHSIPSNWKENFA